MVLGVKNLQPETRNKILETFYACFDDYAVDRRGDVGSWVRQEAMVSVNKYVSLLVDCDDKQVRDQMNIDTPAFFERFISMFL